MVGEHMSDALMVNLGSADRPEKKGSWQRHIPVPLSNVSTTAVFTSIYLKLITSYAHISGLLKWRPVGQIQPPRPFLFGPFIISLNIERHRALVFIWPSDMYLWTVFGSLWPARENNWEPLPYLIDSDNAVFWSYYTKVKSNKAKICIQIGLQRPHFCLSHNNDVTILAKPFVFRSLKHYEILSWPSTCPAMHGVMRSFGAIKTKTHLPFAFDARFRVCTLLVREYAT